MVFNLKIFQVTVLAVLAVGIIAIISQSQTQQELKGQLVNSECWYYVAQGAFCTEGDNPYGGGEFSEFGECLTSTGCICYYAEGANSCNCVGYDSGQTGLCDGAGGCNCNEPLGTCCRNGIAVFSNYVESGCPSDTTWYSNAQYGGSCPQTNGSSSSSSSAAGCGNGTVESGEQCDDGNTANNDGCSSSCRNEFCGDGIQQSNEQCDAGAYDNNFNPNEPCKGDCTLVQCTAPIASKPRFLSFAWLADIFNGLGPQTVEECEAQQGEPVFIDGKYCSCGANLCGNGTIDEDDNGNAIEVCEGAFCCGDFEAGSNGCGENDGCNKCWDGYVPAPVGSPNYPGCEDAACNTLRNGQAGRQPPAGSCYECFQNCEGGVCDDDLGNSINCDDCFECNTSCDEGNLGSGRQQLCPGPDSTGESPVCCSADATCVSTDSTCIDNANDERDDCLSDCETIENANDFAMQNGLDLPNPDFDKGACDQACEDDFTTSEAGCNGWRCEVGNDDDGNTSGNDTAGTTSGNIGGGISGNNGGNNGGGDSGTDSGNDGGNDGGSDSGNTGGEPPFCTEFPDATICTGDCPPEEGATCGEVCGCELIDFEPTAPNWNPGEQRIEQDRAWNACMRSCEGDCTCVADCEVAQEDCSMACQDSNCPGWRNNYPNVDLSLCPNLSALDRCLNTCNSARVSCTQACQASDPFCGGDDGGSSSSGASQSSTSSCPAGTSACPAEGYTDVACMCNGIVTYFQCPNSTCFSCPDNCQPTSSSASSFNSQNSSSSTTSINIDICRHPELLQEMCDSLRAYAYNLGITEDIPDACIGHEVCSDCNQAGSVCRSECISLSCTDDAGFSWNGRSVTCEANSCDPKLCTSDDDCGGDYCDNCTYDEEALMCTQDCEAIRCIQGECRAVLGGGVKQCEDCEVCNKDDRPDCRDGESAFCCPARDWRCVPDGISSDDATDLICNTNECGSGYSCVDQSLCLSGGVGSCGLFQTCCPNPASSSSSSFRSGISSTNQTSSFFDNSHSSSSSNTSSFYSSTYTIASESLQSLPSSNSSSSDTSGVSSSSSSSGTSGASSIHSGVSSSTISIVLSYGSESSITSGFTSSTINSTQSLSSDPTGNAFCGNGIIETGEQCDDANDIDDDGCSNICRVNITPGDPNCGNGIVEDGEQCDDGNVDGSDSCSAICTNKSTNGRCGNGQLDAGEQCDDGNFNYSDGCTPFCRLLSDDNGDGDNDDGIPGNNPDDNGDGDNDDGIPGNNRNGQSLVASANICGNGALEAGEECDDSNRRDNDGCSSNCQLEIGICGDGIVQRLLGEQCESVSHDKSLPYSCVACRFVSPTCGNGTVDPGEECDEGNRNSDDVDATCRPDCSLGRCGDKVLDTNEQCDDGNRRNGDGCDRYCRTEGTQVAGEQTYSAQQLRSMLIRGEISPTEYNEQMARLPFPTLPSLQPVPYQLPLAQLQPLVQSQGPAGETGPAAVAVVGAGAAAGWSWIRRRRR